MEEPPGQNAPAYPVRESTQVTDPDRQCAVPLVSGNVINRGVKNPRCQNRLTCKVHSAEQKERVARSLPLAESLRREPVRLPDTSVHTPKSSTRAPRVIVVDPDVHCAVMNDEGVPCTRSVRCNIHDITQKRKIAGRAMNISDLLRITGLNKSSESALRGKLYRDIHCHVELPQGGRCPGKLTCPAHTLAQKINIERTTGFIDLMELQMKLTSDTDMPHLGGFSLSSAASPNDAEFGTIHKRYRRDGMETAAIEPDPRGEVDSIDFVVCDPVGYDLENLRGLLYHTVDTRPSRNLTDFLPQQKCRTLPKNCSNTIDDGASYHFCFVNKPHFRRTTFEYMQDLLNNAQVTDCCMISVPKEGYALDDRKATMLERRLLDMVERVPCQLSKLTDVFKHRLVVTAMSMESSHPFDVAAKIPYKLEQAKVDNKPAILLRTTQFSDSSSHHTAVAIPLHADVKEGAVAVPSSIFEFHGLEPKRTWSGVELPEEKQSQLRKIAQNVASVIHLTHAEPSHVRWTLVELSKMHGIPLLYRQAQDLEFTTVTGLEEGIAELDEDSGLILPTASASLIAPCLAAIKTTPGTNGGHLVMQCIRARFLHTKDLLLAWSDGANASDMQRQHGGEVMQTFCQCSTEQRTREYHACAACGALSVCNGLTTTRVSNIEVRLCARCVMPRKGAATTQQSQRRAGATQQSSSKTYHYPVSEQNRVKNNISMQMLREWDQVFQERDGLNAERNEAFAALLATYQAGFGEQTAGWADAYFSNLIVAQEGRLACSIETAQPLVWKDGRPREHVTENMLLTKVYANSLATTNGSIALQLLHKLDAAQTAKEKADYVLRLDHLHLIRSQLPWSGPKRLAFEGDEVFQAQLAEQWQTGVADLSACERIADLDTLSSPYLWRMRGIPGWADRLPDRLPEIQSVRKFVEDLEQSTGRTFRRLGDDVPYPFAGGPDPTNWSWSMMFGVCARSYDILKRTCNFRGNTTFNIPRLVCVIFYLLANNGCPVASPLLRLPVSCYTRHLLAMSVGKGNHALDMDTGIPSQTPILLQNFNPQECNLCVEPWCCNTAKGNRDDETDAIREDFRQYLKPHNPPYWNQDLAPLDPEVTARYIQSGPQTTGELGDDDHFETSNGGAGEGDSRDTWEPVLQKRNMKNLGQTCYLSTLLQTLHNNQAFHRAISDDDKLKFKDNTGMPDVSFLPLGERVSELRPKDIVAYRQQKLASIRLLIYKLQKLFDSLDRGGPQLSASDTTKLLDRIAALDPRWQNKSDESAELLDLAIEYLGMACDSSSEAGRGQIYRMGKDQEAENQQGHLLFDVTADSNAYWRAFRGEGHESAVTDMFISQIVKEIPCAQEGCPVVSRNFDHLFTEDLDFPRRSSPDAVFDLEELLDMWKHEVIDLDSGHHCEHVREHPVSVDAHRRFTKPAENICFAFRRGPLSEGAVQYSNPVVLPETLDLAPYADLEGLPSRTLAAAGAPAAAGLETPAMAYDLVAVNNWKSCHYIGYALVKVDDEDRWVMFNDMSPIPVIKTPFEGHVEGEMLHYAVYRKRSNNQPDLEPDAHRNLAGGHPRPEDDVFAMPDQPAGASSGLYTLPRPGGRGSGSRIILRHSPSDPFLKRPGAGLSPLSGTFRQPRRLSGDASNESSPKSPRLEHQTDISASRRELAAEAARIERQVADLARREADLRQKQQQERHQSLRPGDTVMREERIRDLQTGAQQHTILRRQLDAAASRQIELTRDFHNLVQQRQTLQAQHMVNASNYDNQYQATHSRLLVIRQEIADIPANLEFRRLQGQRRAQHVQQNLDQINQERYNAQSTHQRELTRLADEIEAAGIRLAELLAEIMGRTQLG